MAISLVGSLGGSVGGTDLTVDFTSLLDEAGNPADVQAGDLVIVTLCRRASGATAPAVTTSGYSALFANVHFSASDDVNMEAFSKFMGATPDSSVTITSTGFSNTQSYAVHVLRGVDQTTPLDGVMPVTATSQGPASPDAPAVTPNSAGAWIMACGGGAGATGGTTLTALSNPANMDSTAHHFAGGSNDRAIVGAALFSGWSSGSFDPDAFGGGSTASSGSVAAATFVLKPAATGGTGITGTLAASESGADAFAGAGAVEVSGALAIVESGSDAAAVAGNVVVAGSLGAAESGADTFAATGSEAITGALGASEPSGDHFTGSGKILLSGALAAIEAGPDGFAATGSGGAPVAGTMTANEAGGDSALIVGRRDNAYLRNRRHRRSVFADYGRGLTPSPYVREG